MTPNGSEKLMTPAEIQTAVEQLAQDILASFESFKEAHPGTHKLALIGIRTGGDELMRRVTKIMKMDPRMPARRSLGEGGREDDRGMDPRLCGEDRVLEGSLDITLYRDDAHQTLELDAPLLRATDVNFSIENVFTVLVDDVLYTGRTVRAALEALNDFGRPACVKLAVLVDRGGKQLPIAADFVGKAFDVKPSHQVEVVLSDSSDMEDAVVVSPRA